MRKIVLGLFIALLAAGCGSSTKLSLSTRAGTASAAGALTAGGGVDVTHVRIVVERIELEAAGTRSADSSGDAPEDEIVTGPFLIDLQGTALAGGIAQVFEVDAKPGTYKNLKFKIHKLSGGDPQFPGMADLSISIEGTIGTKSFTFTSKVDGEQEPIVDTFTISDGKANNVTLSIDPSGWFAKNGTPLDPTDEANRSEIERNIKASFKAFDDDDRNGKHD
jgi:hypothetical protein